jgi:uncharacterized repeat protein (TIGR03987 family)
VDLPHAALNVQLLAVSVQKRTSKALNGDLLLFAKHMLSGSIFAAIFIVLALICYTIGVWSEKLAGWLKAWHLGFFWSGLASDTVGTTLMWETAGKFNLSVHGFTGALAIVLMAVHAIWATLTLVCRQEDALRNFHRFSLLVWSIWLIPFFSGMVMAMAGITRI